MKRILLAPGQLGYAATGSLASRAPALPALGNSVVPRYYSAEKHDDTHPLGEIGDKARSTAEEFLRVAKEKTDDVTESAKKTLHETKEAVAPSKEDKETYKGRVEEGRYDHRK